MSLERKMNRRNAKRVPPTHIIRPLSGFIAQRPPGPELLKADKGKENGSCNRTACQRPLAGEIEHQFMDGNFTGGPRLFYCERCAYEFDKWDYRSGDPIRIQRELKAEWVS